MNKEKLIQAGFWLSGFSLCVVLSALALYIGFNNQRHGSSVILIIGFLLLPLVFYCAYKGFSLVLDAIFE